MDLADKEQLIAYLKTNHLWTKKSMGQNFLVDRGALDKIVKAAELSESDTVLEIGPGLGTLTEELVKGAGKVITIEKDERLGQLLNCYITKLLENGEITKQQFNNLTIIPGDALKFSPKSYSLTANSYKLVANIPYYITSKILEKFLSSYDKPELIVLLVQKEVAERICAKAGGLSLLAVSVQYYGDPEIIDIIPNSSFFPAPEVESAILRIKIGNNLTAKNNTKTPQKVSEKEFFKVVRAGFRARRKTLFNNLKIGTDLNSGQIEQILDKMGLNRNVRAQELTVEQWRELANRIINKE